MKKYVKTEFIFQIQPYDFFNKPFVIHILLSTYGKASAEMQY